VLQVRGVPESGAFTFIRRFGHAGDVDIAVLRTTLKPGGGEIHCSPAGELLAERGISPLQCLRR